MGKLINRIPGSRLLISSLQGSVLITLVNRSASLAMSTSVLKALPGTLYFKKKHSPSILYISASLAMSTGILKALPGKLDIKRHSPSILYLQLLKHITCLTRINYKNKCKLTPLLV